jgi:hypothetical protein
MMQISIISEEYSITTLYDYDFSIDVFMETIGPVCFRKWKKNMETNKEQGIYRYQQIVTATEL